MNLKKIIIIAFILSGAAIPFLQDPETTGTSAETVVPASIVSLSPSITRGVINLGAGALISGSVDYTLRPDVPLESVGSYVSPNLEKIIRLNPDLVLISDEDRYIQKIPLLRKFGLRVESLPRNTDFSSICSNYMILAEILGRSTSGESGIAEYRGRLAKIKKPVIPPGVVFLVSVKPLIAAGGGSHISSIIGDAGGENVFNDSATPYPILSLEALISSGADALIVMNSGDDGYIYSLLSGYKGIGFINRGNVFVAGDENIPYYTPEDYTISVEMISSLIGRIKP